MTTIASQITSLAFVYSTVYSDADQRKHQSSASLAFVWGIHRDRWIPRTKGQLRGKCSYLMTSSWERASNTTNVFINDVFMKISGPKYFLSKLIHCASFLLCNFSGEKLTKNYFNLNLSKTFVSRKKSQIYISCTDYGSHSLRAKNRRNCWSCIWVRLYIYIYIYIYNVTAGIDCLQYMNNLGTK